MKKLRLIALAALFAVGISSANAAEKGIFFQDTWWRITSGPGAGASLKGDGNIINDSLFGASGHVGFGTECDCRHYHGTLFGDPDPNEAGCGWGCAEEMRSTSDSAL